MANWEKLNKEFYDKINSMTDKDWNNWYNNLKIKRMEKQTELRMTKDVSSTEYISKNEELVLSKKIEIPENSHFNVYESGAKKEYFCESVELLIGIGKDHTASLVMDREAFDALQSGEQLTIL